MDDRDHKGVSIKDLPIYQWRNKKEGKRSMQDSPNNSKALSNIFAISSSLEEFFDVLVQIPAHLPPKPLLVANGERMSIIIGKSSSKSRIISPQQSAPSRIPSISALLLDISSTQQWRIPQKAYRLSSGPTS